MSGLELFWGGLIAALTPFNFAMMLTGLTIGVLAGALPGITMLNAIVLVLPFTYSMDIVPSLLLMTSVYGGGIFGGSITGILFNIPGDPMNVPATWEGYALNKKGHVARALGVAIMGSALGGFLSCLVMTLVSPPFAKIGAVLLLGRVLRGRLPGDGQRRGDQHQVHRLLADRALPRHAARHDRHRRHVRGGAVHVRLAPDGDRDQLHHRPDRALRDRRGFRAALRAQQGAGHGHEGAAQGAPAAVPRDLGAQGVAPAGLRDRHDHRRHPGRRGHRGLVRELRGGAAGLQEARGVRQRARGTA